MNLANPSALFWLALAIPIVGFYILKVRQRRVPVSTTIFWREIFEEKPPRSLWETLRHLLSLLVQLAFLLLLVLALGEPFFRWQLLEARRVVLVVDNSASMSATDVAPSRLARAKEEGRRLIDDLHFRDEMAIIAAGTQPQVRIGLTGHQRTLREALDAIPPTDGPTQVREAVELARRLLAEKTNRKVVLLSDGCFKGAEALVRAADIDTLCVGESTGNVGITQLQVRRGVNDAIGYEVLAEVTNASDQDVECRLEIDLDGSVVDVVPLKLAAGAKWSRVFEKVSAQGGRLCARINRPDALLADNQAWAILPKRDPRRVRLVTDGNLFLEKVFQAIPLVRLTKTTELPAGPAPAGVITVLHQKVPAKLPPGPVLVIDPAGACDLWDLGEKLQNPIVTKQEADSPLLAHVRLDNVSMPEARQLRPKAQAHVLASSLSGDPLLCTFDRPEGKVVVLTVDLDQSDLPLQTAFPILVTNTLSWFSGSRGELRPSLATGAVAEIEPPAPSAPGQTLAIRSPDGHTRPLASNAARVAIGPLDQCGVWSLVRVPAPGQAASPGAPALPEVDLACNLASRQESDIRPAEGLASKSTRLSGGFGTRPVWYYLVGLAWVLVVLEWCLYQRRWIR